MSSKPKPNASASSKRKKISASASASKRKMKMKAEEERDEELNATRNIRIFDLCIKFMSNELSTPLPGPLIRAARVTDADPKGRHGTDACECYACRAHARRLRKLEEDAIELMRSSPFGCPYFDAHRFIPACSCGQAGGRDYVTEGAGFQERYLDCDLCHKNVCKECEPTSFKSESDGLICACCVRSWNVRL